MDGRLLRWVPWLLGLIAALLLVLILILVGGDSGDGSAGSGATTVPASDSTLVPPTTTPVETTASASTTMPAATTAPPATTVPATTTTTAALYLLPDGFGNLVAGADHNALAAAGEITAPSWDFTTANDGYQCGWAQGAGPNTGVDVQLFEWVAVVFSVDSSIRTPEGLGVGSTAAEVIAALGTPTEDLAGAYVETERNLYYESGAHGYRFEFADSTGPVTRVYAGFWDMIHLSEGCV